MRLLTFALLASCFAHQASAESFYFRISPPASGNQSSGGQADAEPIPLALVNVPGTGALQVQGPQTFRLAEGSAVTYAFKASSASGPVRWDIVGPPLPSGMRLSSDGVLSGAPTVRGNYTGIMARARSDSGQSGQTQPFSIVVGTVTATTMPDAASFRLRSGDGFALQGHASGLIGQPTWAMSVTQGALPGGLDFDKPTGTLMGSVATPGDATVTFKATDSADASEGVSSPVRIEAAAPFTVTGLAASYGVHVGGNLSTPQPVVTGAKGVVSFALSPAPPVGTGFGSPVAGSLSGTPSEIFPERAYTLTATDAWDGRTAALSFSVRSNPPLAFASQPQDVTGYVGATLTDTAKSLSNAIGAVSFALLKDGTDAPSALSTCKGLGFTQSGGYVFGTPDSTCSVTGLSIRGSDGTGDSVQSGAFSVGINAAVQASVGKVAYAGKVAVAQTTDAVTVSGATLYDFTVRTISGTAPSSLTVSQTDGKLTFTPAVAGEWTYAIRVNARGNPANGKEAQPVTVTVAGAPSISMPTVRVHQYGTTNAAPTVTGTSPSFTVTLTAGKQAWMTTPVASTGSMTFNPANVSGTFPVTMKVVDAASTTATTTFNVVVLPLPTVTGVPTNLYARVGVPFEGPVPSVDHVVGTLAWSLGTPIQSGGTNYTTDQCPDTALPAGLGIDPVTGRIQGKATASATRTVCFKGLDTDGMYVGRPVVVRSAAALATAGIADTVTVSQGTAYTGTLTATGVLGTATWAFPDALPPGLKVTGTGNARTVSGTPTSATSATYRMVVTDGADGTSVTKTISFVDATPI